MTLDSTKSRKDYDPDGIVDTFAYDFRITTYDDLVVYEDEVVVAGGYTLTGVGNVNGGDVIFDTPPLASVEVLSLRREVPLTQETAYPLGGPFPASSHEAALDKLTMADQQQQEQLDRTASEDLFPTPVAGKRLQWNEAGTAFINVDSEDDEAAAYAAAASDAADDAAAQVLLCAEQVDLAADEVVLAEQAVLDCQDEVVLATAQADAAAISAANAALYDPVVEPYTGLTMEANWTENNTMQIRKIIGLNFLHITGACTRNAGSTETAVTLPVGSRPPTQVRHQPGDGNETSAKVIYFDTDGSVRIPAVIGETVYFDHIIRLV